MATNKHALIRYRTIDTCLNNRGRKWVLEDLRQACSEALYELEGKDSYVSKRTTQLDLQTMRSDKLGYNAPIEVYERKYYRYADPDYSITKIPLSETDLDIISESVQVLRQFKDFSLFAELNGIIQKLEDKVHREQQQPAIIHLDNNQQLKGLEHLDTLYQAILKEIVLVVHYQSFQARQPRPFIFTPLILKEFNNRWFIVGRQAGQEKIYNLALDRIVQIDLRPDLEYDRKDFDAETYYADTFGVTVMGEKALVDVQLEVARKHAPYLLTKPIHPSQHLIEERPDGTVVIGFRVHHNFELERWILGHGPSVKVLSPPSLQQQIRKKLEWALGKYNP